MEELKKAFLLDDGPGDNLVETTIPITLYRIGDDLVIAIDGVEWIRTSNDVHAAVLFNMMQENITEYMQYESK